jgi:hypothetical protein
VCQPPPRPAGPRLRVPTSRPRGTKSLHDPPTPGPRGVATGLRSVVSALRTCGTPIRFTVPRSRVRRSRVTSPSPCCEGAPRTPITATLHSILVALLRRRTLRTPITATLHSILVALLRRRTPAPRSPRRCAGSPWLGSEVAAPCSEGARSGSGAAARRPRSSPRRARSSRR